MSSDEEGHSDNQDERPHPATRPDGEIGPRSELDPTQPPGGHFLASWKGPLPPPEILRAFGEAVPGADVAILEEFRKETDHRRKIEDRESKASAFMSGSVSLSVGSTPLVAIVAGVIMTALGYPWPGFALILGPVAVDARMRWVRSRSGKDASSGQLPEDTQESGPDLVTDGKDK